MASQAGSAAVFYSGRFCGGGFSRLTAGLVADYRVGRSDPWFSKILISIRRRSSSVTVEACLLDLCLALWLCREAQKAPTAIAVAIPVVSFGLPILETMLSVLRRLISGKPVFTADREHIHHKLLQLGMSHRKVVIVLYAVSRCSLLLSLFLLWPTRNTLGLVLAFSE